MIRMRSAVARNVQYSFLVNSVRAKSAKPLVSHVEEPGSEHQTYREGAPIIDTSKIYSNIHISTSTKRKLAKRKPLVKNFCIGVVDKELLSYPEVISRENMSKLENDILPLKNFFEESVDPKAIENAQTIPNDIFSNLKALGIYGFNADQEFGGRSWLLSESLIASEPETCSPDISLSLLSHRVVIDVLNELGTDEQRQRYMTKLATGESIATEAIFEYNSPDDGFFNTTAEYDTYQNVWVLNGEKSFVVAGPIANLFLVIAQTNILNMSSDASQSTTIFLVDSSIAGVEVGDRHVTMGCRGMQSTSVKFQNVKLAENCLLGFVNEGNKVAEVLMRSSRLRNSLIGIEMSKSLLQNLAEHSINNKQFGIDLKEMEILRSRMSKAMYTTYAMESMLYFTAGLLDEFDGQDVALEAAITKYYTLSNLFDNASMSMDIIGPKALLLGQNTEKAFRNAAQLCTQNESLDSLRMFIALTGLQHAGTLIQDVVTKSRNPLFNPMYMFGKFLQASSIDNPKTKMRLADNLHPTLEPAAQCLEHSIARLQMSVEILLTRYGSGVVEKHMEIERLADIITLIYSMFASVSRASRSYCIGLSLADHEVLSAFAICVHGHNTVKTLCTEIFDGQYMNNDNNLQRLSKQVIKSRGYFAVHPLTFNF